MQSTPQLPPQEAGKKQVCILGAGISGLAMAYFLLQKGGYQVVILEKQSEIGGNCRTLDVILDHSGGSWKGRWADMGVNDYNKSTYTMLNALMTATGYNEGPPLEDTESYTNADGSVHYTNDGQYDTPTPPDIIADNTRFQQEAYQDMQNSTYAYYTMGRYVTEKGYSDDFIYNNLYARINGMYFCSGTPSEMPFVLVMSYYTLQEGYGKGAKPDRRYFKGGSMSWIRSLQDKINEMAGQNIIFTGVDAQVTYDPNGGPPMVAIGAYSLLYDEVVLAMHADDAIQCFSTQPGVPPDVFPVLESFQYAPDQSVVHKDTRALSGDINSWRTYNIYAYDFKNNSYGPYTITYVANRHQNDAASPTYNRYENPQFFVSVNPTVSLRPDLILQQPDGQPATVSLRHQKLTVDTIITQKLLWNHQGNYHLWYANGYAQGAGLHEECIWLASKLADQMSGEPATGQVHYNLEPDAEQFAPDYIVHAHDHPSA